MSKRISRRSFLHRSALISAGTIVWLPFLESLAPKGSQAFAATGGSGVPKRFLAYFTPNGFLMDRWTPTTVGADYILPATLESLAAFQHKMQIVTGVSNDPAEPDDGGGSHAPATAASLTAASPKMTEGDDIENGISLDQRIAEMIAGDTRYPSMQLGLVGGASVGDCDSGYSCAYIRNISWARASADSDRSYTPLPKLINPQLVFDRMFGGFDPGATKEELAMRRKHRKSVLDFGLGQASSYMSKVGSDDAQKLDEFMTSVRQLEIQIDATSEGPKCNPPAYPPPEMSKEQHAKVMIELMVLALQCDITRVISFMFANGFSSEVYTDLGVPTTHHELSHHNWDEEMIQELAKIEKYEVEQFAYLLERMDQIQESNGKTLLDNSMVMLTSEMEDGNGHSNLNLPVLYAGGGNGVFKVGEHLEVPLHTPLGNLYLAMLNGFEIPDTSFGDNCTGPLTDILA